MMYIELIKSAVGFQDVIRKDKLQTYNNVQACDVASRPESETCPHVCKHGTRIGVLGGIYGYSKSWGSASR